MTEGRLRSQTNRDNRLAIVPVRGWIDNNVLGGVGRILRCSGPAKFMPDADDVLVQLKFSREWAAKGITFTDAIYVTQAEHAAMTNAEIRALKAARFQAFKDAYNATPREATEAEIQAEVDSLQERLDVQREELRKAKEKRGKGK